MKKMISLILAVMLLTSVFAGCGSKTDDTGKEGNSNAPAATKEATGDTDNDSGDAEPTEEAKPLSGKIVLQIHDGQKVEAFEADAKAFMEANPGTTIEVEFVEAIETIQARMASQDLPDICQVPKTVLAADLPSFYVPLDDIGFTPDNIYFYDKGVVDGKLYNITMMASFTGIIYNKEVFANAGIDKVPLTMDEFWAACEKIKATGVVPFATNYKDKWPLGTYLLGVGGAAFSGDGNYNNTLLDGDIVSGANLEQLDFLRNVVQKGYAEPDLMSTNWGAFTLDIGKGKYGMTYLGSWFPPQTQALDKIGMFPFPGSKAVPMSDDWRYGIAANSESPELAKAYFKHLFIDGAFYETMNYITPLKGVEYEQPFIQELTSFGVPTVELVPNNDELTAVINAFAADGTDIAQEYMITDDTQGVIKKYNENWANAKAAAGN